MLADNHKKTLDISFKQSVFYKGLLAPRCFKWVKLDLLTAKMIVGYAL